MKTLHLSIIAILSVMIFTSAHMEFASATAFQIASFKGNHGTYSILYKIINGTVVGTPLDLPAKALLFEINTTSNGQLTVELPRAIIDSKNGSVDTPYFVSIYDIRSLGGPMKIAPKEINGSDMRILKINFTKDITEIQIVGTFFVEKYRYVAPNSMSSLSPLKQFRSGITVDKVSCKEGLQLLPKAEDGSSACVKPVTAQKLMERGWAKNHGRDIVRNEPSDITKSKYKLDPEQEKLIREKQKILVDALMAEEAKYGGFNNRAQHLPWSSISYDYVDNALEVTIPPQYFKEDALPKYFEKIRSIVGNEIDIALSPLGYATTN